MCRILRNRTLYSTSCWAKQKSLSLCSQTCQQQLITAVHKQQIHTSACLATSGEPQWREVYANLPQEECCLSIAWLQMQITAMPKYCAWRILHFRVLRFLPHWVSDGRYACQVHGDGQPQEHESEEQRVVYKSSPTQRAPSEPPEAVPSLSGRQISADEETLRQRLISAVQRPSGSENTNQLADNLSLR